MTHAHRTRSRPPSDSGPVTAIVILFVAAIGVGAYLVLRDGGNAPASEKGGVASSPAPSAGPARAPADAEASGVFEEYDPAHDRLKTTARGIVLIDDAAERVTLDVSWTSPGRVAMRPSSALIWAVSRTGPTRTLKEDHAVEAICDGKPLGVGGATYDSQRKDDGVIEVVRFSTNLPDFLRAAGSSGIALRVGRRNFAATAGAMGALHTLATRIPER